MTCNNLLNLRPFERGQIKKTFEWISNLDFRKLFLMRGEADWDTHQAHFEAILVDSSQRVFAIFYDGRHVGNCGFKNLFLLNKEGELWIYIGEPSMRHKGIGTRAMELLLREGFEGLGLEKIYLHVADYNIAARRMYERMGFVEVPVRGNTDEWANRGCKIIRMEVGKPV